MRPNPRRPWTVATLACLVSLVSVPAPADPPDPLLPLLNRVRAYTDREEVEGITQDPRYPLNPSETTRLSIVSQLLAYNELYAIQHQQKVLDNVLSRADFLVQRLPQIRSNTAFDGMLAYALLGAYEITGDARYLAAGQSLVVPLLGSYDLILNGGLMAAMGMAKCHQLTGDPAMRAKVQAIVSDLSRYQNADGSFPHWCYRSKDVHYTAWMGMELIHIRRYVPSVKLDAILQRLGAFVERRVLPGGDTQYEGPCDAVPTTTCRYYSRASGCSIDYDTRAWINELGYTALVLDRRGSPRYADAMALLYDLEGHGAWDDKWAYPPPVYDPIYPWATGQPSVIRTSIVFWSLATLHRERVAPALPGAIAVPPSPAPSGGPQALADEDPTIDLGSDAEPLWRGFVWSAVDRLFLEGADPAAAADNDLIDLGGRDAEPFRSRPAGEDESAAGRPARDPWPAALEYTLERPGEVALAIYDLAGRRVRELAHGRLAVGRHAFVWDGMDAGARPCPPGMYFARLRVDGLVRLARPIRWAGR